MAFDKCRDSIHKRVGPGVRTNRGPPANRIAVGETD
jgi:hypothetical protein